jgi:hypothetical protein
MPTKIDWASGDHLGLDIPAHSDALRAGGPTFLTRAFRASCAISEDNSVRAVTRSDEIEGGSTGRKLLLTVEYEQPSPGLHTNLFVKFSRDFDDRRRDAARIQMELEVLFALLSRDPAFPIAVPACYFADFHHDSGTGILITERVGFGAGGIEPHYPKCLDHRMPDQFGHYRAIIAALGRLAGTHRAGRLSDFVESHFPFEPGKLAVSARAPYTPQQVSERVSAYAEFARRYPAILPQNVRSAAFLSRLADEAPRFQAMESIAKDILQSRPEMIALCHWNAHVDNAWFWQDPDGKVECGLMDWGNVCQMNVAMAIWGCLSAAEVALWDNHLDQLLGLFLTEFENCGGPAIDEGELRLHLNIYVAMMGLAWMLDAPALILAKVPDLDKAKSRLDPMIQDSERGRSQLLIMTNFLNLWEQQDMPRVLEIMEKYAASADGKPGNR